MTKQSTARHQSALSWARRILPALGGVGFLALSACTPRAPIDPAATGDVQGSLHTVVADQTYPVEGIDVFLKDDQDVRVATGRTDARGRYLFKTVPGGYHWLCWEATGWADGCAPNIVRVENSISYPPSQELDRDPESKLRRVAGRVSLRDGASPVFAEPFIGVDNPVEVVALDGLGTEIARTLAGPTGTFALAGLDAQELSLRVDMPGFSAPAAAVAPGTDDDPQALRLDNHRPEIVSLTARPSQGPRFLVTPGALIRVVAEVSDPDGRKGLTYRWKPAPANGEIVSTSDGSALWRLADREGPQRVYVTVEDGRGGFATQSVGVVAGARVTAFGGRVLTAQGEPIGGAEISINVQQYLLGEGDGRERFARLGPVSERPVRTRSGEDGAFLLDEVPLGERFVMNISAPGRVPISRIFDGGNVVRDFRMEEAFVTRIDLERPVEIRDERKVDDRGARQDVTVRLLEPEALVVEGEDAVARGPVRVEIASLDLRRNEMPGDYTTMTRAGLTGLRSFGAVNVDFFDGDGNALQLRKGQRAEVSIAAPERMRDRPKRVPLYYYDETTGLWEPYEEMAVYDERTDRYVGFVDHFSSVNVDAPLTDTSCVRLLTDNLSTGNGYVARFAFPSLAQTYDVPIDEALSVLRRIPPNEAGATVTILDSAGSTVSGLDVYQFDFASGQTPLPQSGGSYTFTSGGIVAGNFTLLRPYEGCQTLSVRRTNPSNPDLLFLQRSYGVGSDALTQGYYSGLDPAMSFAGGTWSGGTHATLGDWWAASGFSNTGVPLGSATPGVVDRASAAYMNYNDLGFGRNMTIRKDTVGGADRVFAYVSNHADIAVNGGANQNPANAAFARLGTNGFATVVMESTLVNGTENTVTFFVYGGTDASAPLINSADLDGFGQKFVPGLCQVCHGGAVYAPANPAAPSAADLSLRPSPAGIGASLREFDLESYLFEPADRGPANLSAAEEAEFYKLNALVKDSRPQPNIVDLIDGWYSGVSLNVAGSALNGTPDYFYVPTGWQGSSAASDFYTDVVAKSCRTCHIAFDGNGSLNDISWHDQANFDNSLGFSDFLVCDINSGNVMPHALMTYRNFWLEGMGPPYEPDAFAAYSGQACN